MSVDIEPKELRRRRWTLRNLRALVPAALLWMSLVVWLAYELNSRGTWLREADEANLREWFSETNIAGKTLPAQVREYIDLVRELGPEDQGDEVVLKREAIEVHLRALTEPTRVFNNQIPMFPRILAIEIDISLPSNGDTIRWRPHSGSTDVSALGSGRHLEYPLVVEDGETLATLRCDYQLHAYNLQQEKTEQEERTSLLIAGLIVFAALAAFIWVYRTWRNERRRELRIFREERKRQELERQVLQESLEKSQAIQRSVEAERTALEMKSQLFAGIGIMAGSYAHNIKNLLVRPNDLLDRCLETDGLSPPQQDRLREVRQTLDTVTERLQQILATVRRDPSQAQSTRLDLNELLKELRHAWSDVAREKWKLTLRIEPGPALWITADPSHLQQAVENLLFNARDAIFEKRNYLRDRAYDEKDPDRRRQSILDAARWGGNVIVRTFRQDDQAILEVGDDGIGMPEDVRAKCLETHFSTKRDNALYAGLSAGTGLGLSFVTVVLEHHRAKLEIESTPLEGTTFRLRFPSAGEKE